MNLHRLSSLEGASHAQWTVRDDDVIRSQLEPLGERETIGAMLARNATLLADHAAYAEHRQAGFRKVSWSELQRDVSALGAFLTTSGVQPGDRVAVVSPNRGAMLTVELATMCLGAIYVPIFAGYSAMQTTTLLAHARPKVVVLPDAAWLSRVGLPSTTRVVITFARSRLWKSERRAVPGKGGAFGGEIDSRVVQIGHFLRVFCRVGDF